VRGDLPPEYDAAVLSPPVPPPPPTDCAITPNAPSPAVVIRPELSSPTLPAVFPEPPLPPIATDIEIAGTPLSGERSTARAAAAHGQQPRAGTHPARAAAGPAGSANALRHEASAAGRAGRSKYAALQIDVAGAAIATQPAIAAYSDCRKADGDILGVAARTAAA